MLIQPLLFPSGIISNEPKLFFQGISSQNISDDSVVIPSGSKLSLETYFNSFSIGKWCKYTNISNLILRLTVSGQLEIKAYHAIGTVENGLLEKGKGKLTEDEYIHKVNTLAYKAVREEISYSIIQEDDTYTIKFNQIYPDGIIYVTIKAITEATLINGGYETEIDVSLLSPVKLAVGICTFKREAALTKNVNSILKGIINNPASPLKDKLEIYIADNGQTLEKSAFESRFIHIFPNSNVGGAGGFTRTMIEAMLYDEAKSFTHIILMDDDILLYTFVLERTYLLLCMLKSEYRKAILGASMFLDNLPTVQQEVGAEYKNSVTWIGRANHKYFDMGNPDAVSANEVVNKTNYTGWWYTCIPRTVATEANLPMPYFIHYDDTEYGIRNAFNGQIFINGICVWHPAPANKGPIWIAYYNVRNRLITMFSYSLGRKNLFKYILASSKLFLFQITRYEYGRARLMLQALQDFLQGPDVFVSQDTVALHQNLLKDRLTFVFPEEAGVDRKVIVRRHHKNFFIAGTVQLFCNLLPAKDSVAAVDGRYFSIPYRAGKLFIYDNKSDKGYILKRDQKAFFRLLFGYIGATWKLFWRYKGLLHDWQEAKPTLTSLPFWEKYLGLNHKE